MFRILFITILNLTGFYAQFSPLDAGCSPQCHCTESKNCGCLSGDACHCNYNNSTPLQKKDLRPDYQHTTQDTYVLHNGHTANSDPINPTDADNEDQSSDKAPESLEKANDKDVYPSSSHSVQTLAYSVEDTDENIHITDEAIDWEDGAISNLSAHDDSDLFYAANSPFEVDENLDSTVKTWERYDDPEWCCNESNRYCWPGFIPRDNPTFGPCCLTGSWMPERPPLFRPFIADPRQPTYSLGWRFNDNALTKNVVDVSYYDSFPIYGWCNYLTCGDKLQVDLEGCLWAVFYPCSHATPLVNADYYVAIPVTYAYKQWSARLRIFHISSHVGDEFLIENPGFDRRNPSAEYLDGFVSYYLTDDIRLYGGLGWVMQQDDSFYVGNFYTEGGVEARICPLGRCDSWNRIYGVPFIAMYFRKWKNFKHHVDATYALGYEIGKTNGLERRLRIYIAYHDGYSVEGQWSKIPTNYLSLKMQYGF